MAVMVYKDYPQESLRILLLVREMLLWSMSQLIDDIPDPIFTRKVIRGLVQ